MFKIFEDRNFEMDIFILLFLKCFVGIKVMFKGEELIV